MKKFEPITLKVTIQTQQEAEAIVAQAERVADIRRRNRDPRIALGRLRPVPALLAAIADALR